MPAAEFVALAILLVTIIGLLRQPFGTRDWMWTMAAAAIVLATGLLSLQDAESTLASVVILEQQDGQRHQQQSEQRCQHKRKHSALDRRP